MIGSKKDKQRRVNSAVNILERRHLWGEGRSEGQRAARYWAASILSEAIGGLTGPSVNTWVTIPVISTWEWKWMAPKDCDDCFNSGEPKAFVRWGLLRLIDQIWESAAEEGAARLKMFPRIVPKENISTRCGRFLSFVSFMVGHSFILSCTTYTQWKGYGIFPFGFHSTWRIPKLLWTKWFDFLQDGLRWWGWGWISLFILRIKMTHETLFD